MGSEQYQHLEVVIPVVLAQATILGFALRQSVLRRQRIVALVGIAWCLVALWIEKTLEHDPKYSPFCDFASWAKCSLVLTSPYGRLLRYWNVVQAGDLLDVPNPVLGLVFYVCHLFYALLKRIPKLGPYIPALGFLFSSFVLLLTFYLACVLFFRLRDFCLACVSTYVCNLILWKVITDALRQTKLD